MTAASIKYLISFSLLTMAGSLNAPATRAQSQGSPNLSFEVASIKPARSETGSASGHTGEQYFLHGITLKNLITIAYGIQGYQISGGPDWIDIVRYDVDAKTAGVVPRSVATRMLQPLIEERFNLKFHRENREGPVYSLIVAKGGHKLQQAKDEDGNPMPNLSAVADSSRTVTKKLPGGSMVKGGPGTVLSSDREIYASASPVSCLAESLARVLHRKVIDNTGIVGLFDIYLG